MMTLFGSSRSPYVRKVMVAAHEIGVQDRLTLLRKNVAILKPDDEVIAANPLGKIPVLVLEDGTSLYDSSVICEFLDGLRSKPTLFPTDSAARRQPPRRACRRLLSQNDHDARPSGTQCEQSHGRAVLHRAAHDWMRPFL